MKRLETNVYAGPTEWFTGNVTVEGLRNPDEQTNIGAAHMRFSPGGRTFWHTHPYGQTIYVTDGIGYVCRRGSQPEEVRAGDVVYFEPDEEHWHGATLDRFMAHIAMQEADTSGNVVTWLEPAILEHE